MKYSRKCQLCSKKFKTNRVDKVFCCHNCRFEYARLKRMIEIVKLTDEEKKLYKHVMKQEGKLSV